MRQKSLLAVLAFSLIGVFAHAQSAMKIGYADIDFILGQMPESKEVESQLQTTNTQLQNQLQAKYQEYEQKLQAYQQSAATMLDAVRQEKETELTQLQQRIQKFQQDAQGSLQKKTAELMEPLYTKVGNTIEAVAKEKGYTHVLNGQVGGIDVVLYADEKYDISNEVLLKMGITPPNN
ncbi:OmpH family outer membrane protein [Fulvivirga sp. M361]|uniref:OmpH family outer membrane protein n=1 Tax=Fulvivirga sp. M361 TaxID=2594266 RepID=UPI00117B3768|nr:OmpH family outer membrane protein [Fulvivirga sp. M361]TRX50432.1 OmpH family outer membrane protein [Fulvivirga sp. M361]